MACQAVGTGERFVAEMIAHIDCQAQAIGAYGYGSLADPGSATFAALTGLLAIFVALFGYRLLFGEPLSSRDLVGAVLRIGIVLTLATSWPAWRTLGYDVVIRGPAEIAAAIGGASGLPGTRGDMAARLQGADDAIAVLTVYGTGRNLGGTNRSNTVGDSFRSVASTDMESLSSGRFAFLAGTIGPLAVIRIGAGLLLALAPLMAGLLLFAGTRDLFFGWLRALGGLALGGVVLSVVSGVQLAILEPWLRSAIALRAAEVLTPSAPTELNVITSAFALVSLALLALIAKIVFFGGLRLPNLGLSQAAATGTAPPAAPRLPLVTSAQTAPSRAFLVAEAVSASLRREERSSEPSRMIGAPALAGAGSGAATGTGATGRMASAGAAEPLGTSMRSSAARRVRRGSGAFEHRDNRP
jgi:type IV secretion system protein VirB6